MFVRIDEVRTCTDDTIVDFWCKLYRHDVLSEGTRPSQDPDLIAAILSEMSERKLYKDPRVKAELSKVTITLKQAYSLPPFTNSL